MQAAGSGRHAYFAATYGAREVVALDLSDAVEAARATCRALDNVHVVQGDLLRPPFRTGQDGGGFDLVYSIGVLHHLPDPVKRFREPAPAASGREARSRSGSTATRTTGSSATSSSRSGASRRRFHRASSAGSRGHSRPHSTLPRKASTGRSTARALGTAASARTSTSRASPTSASGRTTASSSTSSSRRRPRTSRGRRSRAGSRRAGSKTSASRTGTATRGAGAGVYRLTMGVNSDISALLELIVCPLCHSTLAGGGAGSALYEIGSPLRATRAAPC